MGVSADRLAGTGEPLPREPRPANHGVDKPVWLGLGNPPASTNAMREARLPGKSSQKIYNHSHNRVAQ